MENGHESKDLTVAEPRAIVSQQETYIPVQEIMTRLNMVRDLRDQVMEDGVHFGVIPGTEKPTLYQAGADMLRMMFNLQPAYNIMRDEEVETPHRGYIVHTTLTHSVTGAVWGQGVGSCSTMESKYRWRTAKRICPSCQADAISKSKEEYGGGFYCRACKAKYAKNDQQIVNQALGKVENPDVADQYNTVLKLAKKRSFVDAILNATGAREKFSNVPGPDEREDAGIEDDLPPVEEQRAAVLPQRMNPSADKPISTPQLNMLLAKQKAANISDELILDFLKQKFQIDSRKDIPQKHFNVVLEWIDDAKRAPERTGK